MEGDRLTWNKEAIRLKGFLEGDVGDFGADIVCVISGRRQYTKGTSFLVVHTLLRSFLGG